MGAYDVAGCELERLVVALSSHCCACGTADGPPRRSHSEAGPVWPAYGSVYKALELLLPVLFAFGGVDDTPSVPGFCSWFVRTPGGGTAILGVSAIAAVGLSPACGGEVW